MDAPKEKPPRRRAKQRWPFVKKRTYPNGTVAWMVDARTKTGGERKTFETQVEAESHAEQCRIRRSNEGVGAFGNKELARHGKTVQDAITFYVAYLRLMERSIPVKDAVTAFLAARKGDGVSVRYQSDIKQRLARFTADFGDHSIAALSAATLDEWLRGLPVGAVTRNTFRLRLSALFSFARKRGWVRDSPVADVEKAKEPKTKVQVFSPEQAARLLSTCSEQTLPFWALALFAGLRPDSEIGRPNGEKEFRLDWSDIDFDEKVISVAAESKTGERVVPMTDNLIEWLKPYRNRKGKVCAPGYVQKLQEDKRRLGYGTAGSETPEEILAGVTLCRWVEDICRHSYGSYSVAAHHDAGKVATWMGNSVAVVKQRYWKRVKPSEAARFWALVPISKDSAKITAFPEEEAA